MSVRTWWPLLLGCALFTACEPRTVEVQGLDELTAEIRSQRLLNRQRAKAGVGSNGATVEVRAAQIQLAMAPLRDVLTQLATSQSELSGRQATLTQEMRRWTQLLVQSMQSERSDEASKLSERLAELEKSIAEQDKRHRKVEELIGSALDNTADKLELFLNRVGATTDSATSEAVSPKGGGQPTPATGPTGNGEANSAGIPKVPTGTGAPPAVKKAAGGQAPEASAPPTTGQPDGSAGNMASQRSSLAWLWGLAVMSLVSGFVLLFSKKRGQPLAIAPEMQFAPEQPSVGDGPRTPQTITEARPASSYHGVGDHETDELVTGDVLLGDLASGELPHDAQAEGQEADGIDKHDKPEIEELWAAAALLGEAIGRLKQTGEPIPPELGGQQPLPETPDSDREQAEVFPRNSVGHAQIDEVDAVRTLGLPGPDRSPVDGKQSDGALTSDDHTDDTVIDLGHPGDIDAHDPSLVHTPEEPVTVITIPPASAHTAARHTSSAPITCHLHLSGDEHAEGRVRNILGRDPRVLVSPAPQVRTGMGELEVSYALLPGLTAGERSLLEQQLRDTVT